MRVRKSVFSGSWYPDNPAGCEKEIKGFLKEYPAKTIAQRDLNRRDRASCGMVFFRKYRL